VPAPPDAVVLFDGKSLARFRPDGALGSPARLTVIHNGILVQDDVEPWGPTAWLQHIPYTAHADKQKDLRQNPAVQILLAIDPSSLPLGTGPKPHEIWHEGYYPVVWTNRNYRMAYVNMGHNDLGEEGSTLSSTFASATQNQLIRQLLYWLAGQEPPRR
jgi:hypothetical protein